MGRVGIDVATKFASQVGDGSENATGNDLRFDLSEPDLDLVQPGRIGRGEVKLHARMLCEELSNRLRFMSGEVVDNDMNLLPRRAQGYDFIQESKEITTAVPGRQNRGPQCRRQHRGLLAGMIGIEPIESGLKEALLPADDGRGTRLQSGLDGVEGSSLGQHQDELDFATCRHTNLEA